MFNVCPNCEDYRVNKEVIERESETVALCAECQHERPFLRLPLFIVVGASGVGKSTTQPTVTELLRDEAVVIEGDILYDADQSVQAFGDMWLRVCKNIAQSGRPVVLFASGLIPQNLDTSFERRYFSQIHHLALTCEPQAQQRRLEARPRWRGTEWRGQYDYNRWFREQSGLPLIDTTEQAVEDSAEKIAAWVRARL